MNVLSKVYRYWHTLRHLRLVQIYGRFWFRLWKPKPDLSCGVLLTTKPGQWKHPARRITSLLGPRSFVFLNQTGQLDDLGWNGPQREKLWRYNQHYFEDLTAKDAGDRLSWHAALVEDWIAHNPPGVGDGWEPYPLSIRVVNWIKWGMGEGLLSPTALQSLTVQVRWLICRLEYHLLGSHLFANAKALVLAGLFFEGCEADEWLEKGLRILAQELDEQLLEDGCHFERSTMYSALVLEDMLDLVNATQCFGSRLTLTQRGQVDDWPKRAKALHAWLLGMRHSDGEISLFNDAAFDITPSMDELDAYARRILVDVTTLSSSPLLHFQDSGYIRLAHGSALAILDVAPVGPDYLPGHAHADTLTFELSVGTQRVLVNSGTSCYGSSEERLRQRGTAAHNTVVVDGQNSSEVWGGFRVARRAYPYGLQIESSEDLATTEVRCAHNGYMRLAGKPIHHRIWRMDAHGLTVSDRVEGDHQSAEARFHFHPAIKVSIGPHKTEGTAKLPNGTVMTWLLDHGQARLDASTWHPRFGHAEPNVCLVVQLVSGSCALHFSWASAKI